MPFPAASTQRRPAGPDTITPRPARTC